MRLATGGEAPEQAGPLCVYTQRGQMAGIRSALCDLIGLESILADHRF